MANDFSGDANCVALYRFEDDALTVDSKDSNTLTPMLTVNEDLVNFKEGACAVSLGGFGALYRSNGGLSSDFPFKANSGNEILSIAAWIYPTVIPGSGNIDTIVGQWYVGGGASHWVLALIDSTLRFGLGYNSCANQEYWTICILSQANRWYHIGLTYDAVNKLGVVRVWDDVAQIATTYPHDFTNSHSCNGAPFFMIGADGAGDNFFNGKIDEIPVFNRILSIEEIDAIRMGAFPLPSGPTQAQLLRHGTWFGSGVKQRMWWAR